MSVEAAILFAAALLLAVAVLRGRQSLLMAAVLAYAGVAGWLVQSNLDLLGTALALAIGLGIVGLGRAVHHLITSQDDTSCDNSRKKSANNRVLVQNIGS